MRFATELAFITEHLEESYKEKHNDLLLLIDWVRFKYSRNVFHPKGSFNNYRHIMTSFDYEYLRKNNTPKKLLDIQKKLYEYRRIFKEKNIQSQNIEEYLEFINSSLHSIANEISVPIDSIPLHYISILSKYKNDVPQSTKSSKINYDVLKLLSIEI